MRPDFDKAHYAATELLLRQQPTSLFLDVRDFILPSNVTIESMQYFSRVTHFPFSEFQRLSPEGALLLRHSGQYIVLYDDSISNEARKHWGIAHELGHIFLDHTTDYEKEEKEAHFFAAQLIMPEIVLIDIAKRKGTISASDILQNFNASYQSAAKRIDTLNRRHCWNSDSRDRALLDLFSPVLDRTFGSTRIA